MNKTTTPTANDDWRQVDLVLIGDTPLIVMNYEKLKKYRGCEYPRKK